MRLLRNDIDTCSQFEIERVRQWLLDTRDEKIKTFTYENEEEATWIDLPDDLLVEWFEYPINSIVAY